MNSYDYESESDSDSEAIATEVAPAQYQAGYNSYGRPSMAMGSTNTFHQQQQQQSSEDDGSSDEDSDDESAVAAPIQPRGKTFRPPVGEGDSSSSSSEDEGDLKPPANNVAPPAQINPDPGPPRGKELRLISKPDSDSSSDDEPLSHMGSKDKDKARSNGKKKAAPKKTTSKAATKKTTSKAGASKKRKAPPSNDSDSDSDEECIATIVGSDTDGVMAVAEVIPSNKKAKANDGTAKKKAPAKKPGPKRKPGPKKGTKKPPSVLSSASILVAPEVSSETAAAASAARTKLQNAVTKLPHKVAESHIVRSFGRIKPEYGVGPFDALYSNPGAIYPIGFSCDRLEFSPVHGRVVRMRCDILDGSLLKEGRKGATKVKSEKGGGAPVRVNEKNEDLGDGPVFRVTWGEGVEEDKLLEPSCPFDPYVASAHLGGDVDAIAIPLSSKTGKRTGMPEVGTRVSVRVDKGKMYGGAITNVAPIEKRTKNKKATCNITIHYDDGVSEVAAFPDPDIILASGCPPVETPDGIVTEMNGKPVHSVLAKTPLEAWGKTLLSLGLIDEIIYGAALEELQSARQNGFGTTAKKRADDKAKGSPTRRSNRRISDGDDEVAGTEPCEDLGAGWTKKVVPRKSDSDKTDTYYFSPEGKQCRSMAEAKRLIEENAKAGASQGAGADDAPDDKMGVDKDDKREEPSPEEVQLRKKLAELRKKLEAAKKRSNEEAANLANARIAAISPFATNPFVFREDSTVETTWLASAVKKEKGKMSNTGNKRKIVTPATMMDKQDTFFLPKIERLVEGLPGTEFAPSYVFHANRSSTSTGTAWIHEAKLKHQKQQQKKQEKELKMKKQAEARADKLAKEEEKKERKRKLKEEGLAEQKRLREEKEEKKKKDRVEKRLAILNSQMDDRLFKEGLTVRERNIMNFVRGLNKEFTRRKKAAELTVASKIDCATASSPSLDRILVPFQEALPPLSRAYDAEVVRIWDFLHSFSQVFSTATRETLPSLDSLQDALHCLKTSSSDQQTRAEATKLFERIAIELCQVISPSLTKTLSTSVLNVEAIGKNGTEGGPQEDEDVACLPCTEWTWREVARMIIVNDALTDLGYSKQESANLTKGYRSGGHPNSREAKRWKKIEESPIVMMYHRLEHHENDVDQFRRRTVRATFSTPCTPSSSVPSDWRFFLHNIKSRSSNSHRFIKSNVSKALAALKKTEAEANKAQASIADLEKCLAMLEKSGHGSNSGPELHKAKQLAVRVLDATSEKCPPSFSKDGQDARQMQLMKNQADSTQEPSRQRMGFQKMYQMSSEQFKAIEQSKEEYMAAALRLKEELERKNREDANEDDDEDDEDEEAEDKGDKPDEDSKKSTEEPEPRNSGARAKADADKPDESAAGNDEAKKDDKAGATADKPAPQESIDPQEAINLTGHPTLTEKDISIAAEPAGDSFPEGWVTRRVPRAKHPSENRWDRFWYSPTLGLKFRSKADAMRFIGKVDNAQGDEAVAIMDYHGRKKPSNIVNKAASKPAAKGGQDEEADVVTYEFTEDVPDAPDLIRRCLAVLRTVSASNSADQFIYPVDPQLYPGYYETVMNPTSLYDIGKFLQEAGAKFASNHADPEIEEVVATVGRQVRTIVQNTICVNSSNNIVNSAEEMLRLFERLFFDWVLAPSASRPAFEHLDDDRCIDHHESDANSMVLLCDACEGKYNMSRLKPALTHVPSGAWYCPRCVAGTSWLTVDPRLGRLVKKGSYTGTVQSCKFIFAEDGKPSIIYRIMAVDSGRVEYWGVEDVDELILGESVEPLSCLQAIAESPGYGFGRDSGVAGGALPMAVNPLVGDKAAEAALSSGVFQDTVSACVSLAHPPEEFTGEEWTTLLMLLVTKCSQSDDLQELSSKLETDEGSKLSSDMMTFWRNRGAKNVIADHSDDDSVSSEENASPKVPEAAPSSVPPVVESKAKKDEVSQAKQDEPANDIVMKSSAEDDDRPSNMEISFSSSTGPDEASSSTSPNAKDGKDGPPKEAAVLSKEDILRKKRESALLAKAKRERKREESLMGYYVGYRLKATAASFDEDIVSAVVRSTLCSQEEGLELSSVRCRETCHYCGLSDVALGAPLCRAPNEKEWRETFPHVVHDRTTYMIAEVPDTRSEDDFNAYQERAEPPKTATMHVAVTVRVGGELVSAKTKCFDNSAKHFDAAMHQFLPKNPMGFQSELKFRHESNLTILSGSHTAHEVCAIAAHRHRKDKLLTERIATKRANMTRKAALICGKSVPIGTDPFGRSYWVFSAEPSSLFVCQVDPTAEGAAPRNLWRRFHKPEEIASIMVCLGKIGPLTETLKDAFPEAAKLAKDRTWSTLLMGRSLHSESEAAKASSPSEGKPAAEEQPDDYGPPFVEDEDVLVESENGKFLWDAVVVSVSKDPDTDKVNGYLVHYKNWSSRFDQWVEVSRVVEPNQTNLEVQEEVMQDLKEVNDATPPMLEGMFAFQFLSAKKRARSDHPPKTDIFECAFARPSASPDEKLLGLLKGAILLIEAALPRGSIGPSFIGAWNPESAALWRNLVKDAQGPESLMKCLLLLEDAINPDWMHSQATQLYASLPTKWRAVGEASLSSIALRVSIMDRCLKYALKRKKGSSLDNL